MNKNGQVIAFTLMLAVVIIILALAMTYPISEAVGNARNESSGDTIGLNCTTTTDEFVQGTCIVTDLFTPYFIGFVIALAGAVVGAKILFGRTNE